MAKQVVDCFDLPDESIIAAPCTPFKQNGDINEDGFKPYFDLMCNSGITGLFVNGTLGEGMNMTTEERKTTLDIWMSLKKSSGSRMKTIIAHVGAGSIRDTITLAEHAAAAGVDAVAVMCPTLFKPSNISQLVTYLKAVADRIPNTPFLYYDINVLTGVIFDTGEVMRQCKEQIANFSGIKYSCRELAHFDCALMESEGGRYKFGLGTVDEVFLPWLTLGTRVPICHSMMAPIHLKTRQAYLAGDMNAALESQRFAQRIATVKRKYGADVSVSKAMIRMVGVDLGPVRLPLINLTDETYEKVKDDLISLGVL